jgi:predicted nucleic acid-binding protein
VTASTSGRRAAETIAAMDLLIAVSVLVDGARLATRDRRHFERVPGLDLLRY